MFDIAWYYLGIALIAAPVAIPVLSLVCALTKLLKAKTAYYVRATENDN